MSNAPARPWIGSSSVAAWANLSPFSTPLQEYRKAIGEAPELLEVDEAFFRRRRALEPYVAAVVQDRYGMKLVSQNIRYPDPEHDFLRAEIDFEAIDRDGIEVNGEIKTVNPYAAKEWGEEGSDGYPIYVAAQVQQGLALRPKPRAVLIACIGFDEFRRYDVMPDPDVAAQLRAIGLDAWHNHVLARVPPLPVSAEDVKLRYALSRAQPIEATDEVAELVRRHAELGGELKVRKEEADEVALRLKLFLGDCDTLTRHGQVLATWRTSRASRVTDWQALALSLLDVLEDIPGRQGTRDASISKHTTEKPGNRPLLNKLK